jgi:eukaryotic-like serine/threonine-protein kinase
VKQDRAADVERLFHEALERDPSQRHALLATQCAGDEALRSEIESLLAAHDRADGFLEQPFPSPAQGQRPAANFEPQIDDEAAMIGRRVGPWRLTKRIGVGGMADVYLAERADGQYEQQAAIKLIRRGVSGDPALRLDLIRRLWDERQHLANLDHPNIARLIDGGTTEDGLPYLGMEYIPGQSITRYCQERQLPIRQRLELFRRVCEAVQYAHSKFVAHRDLKPSNILVTGGLEGKDQPIPKLLDFGIAKLAKGDELASPAPPTRHGLRPMTLEYASPEQVSGQEITTATDVYSLGVILYELVTDRLPYEVDPYDARSVICEQRPPRPGSIKRSLSRELDTIILKAMEKAPARRYPSAAALAEDLERYVAGKPVLARAPTVPYVLWKFLARHASRVAAVVFLVAAVVATTALFITLARQAKQQSSQVVSQARADRLFAIARNNETLDDLDDAENLLEMAMDIERELPRDSSSDDPAKLLLLGRILCKQRQFANAEPVLTQAIELLTSATAAGSPVRLAEARRWLAACRIQQGRYQEAGTLLSASYPVFNERFGPTNPQTQDVLRDLVFVAGKLGLTDEVRKYEPLLLPPASAQPTTMPERAPAGLIRE